MKEKICEKALELFLEQGYDATALSQIASASNLTKAGLYHYFPDKESLLHEIHKRHILQNFVPILEEIEKVEDPADRISYFVSRYTTMLTQDRSAKMSIQEAKRLKPKHREEIAAFWRRAYNILAGAIRELQATGRGKDLNVAFTAFAVIGMTSWTFYWFDYGRQETAAELARTFNEIFLRGLLREGTPP
ncbi:MAG: TetR/AcrR family transcriptional regulator [Deferrisomatales bacterium]